MPSREFGVLVAALGLLWFALIGLANVRWKHSVFPVLLVLLGVGAAAFPAVYSRLVPIDLGPFETRQNGELQLTLTGWDRKDTGSRSR